MHFFITNLISIQHPVRTLELLSDYAEAGLAQKLYLLTFRVTAKSFFPQKNSSSGEATGVLRPLTPRGTAVNAEEGVQRLSCGACYLDREERETDDVGSLCFVSSELSLEEAAAADRLFERRRRRNTPTDGPTAAVSDAASAAQTQRRGGRRGCQSTTAAGSLPFF